MQNAIRSGSEIGNLPIESRPYFVQRLRDRLSARFRDFGPINELYVTRSTHRSLSQIYHVIAQFPGGRVVRLLVKICDGAEGQYTAMTSLWPHFASHRCWKIPHALEYIAEDSALVMEEVLARPFTALLPRCVWREQDVVALELECGRIGQWLRFFHELGREANTEPLNEEGEWPGLIETMAELRVAGLVRRLLPVLEKSVAPEVDRVVRVRRPISILHGDFSIDNILLTSQAVFVVDFSSAVKNSVDFDIASFLNSLVSLRLTRFVPASAIQRMSQRFLFGYFGAEQPPDVTTILLQCMGLADVALEVVSRRGSFIAHWWVEYILGQALQRLSGELARAR